MQASPGNPSTSTPGVNPSMVPQKPPVTLYHWVVVILASCGWLFDCMGQRIFVLGREPAFRELLGATASDSDVKYWGGVATFALMIGWATGGILFGIMSDRYGRVKAMVVTLLGYTIFSAVSGFARSPIEFLVYRFLFGLGVGGMFGAATTLVAESVPAHFRTVALGSMQALSALGNMLASGLSLVIVPGQENFWGRFSGWQVLFFVGVAPAVLAVPMLLVLKEPEPWKRAKEAMRTGKGKSVGSMSDLFRHPRWRKSTFIGICLGLAGMVGLWGIAFFSPELITTAFKDRPLRVSEILKPADLVASLNTPSNPAADYFKAKLDPKTAASLPTLLTSANSTERLTPLVEDLDRLIHGPSLYNAQAFERVDLKKNTRNLVQLVEKTGEKRNTAFLNRQLLEQAFPGTIQSLQQNIDQTRSRGTMLQDVGALLGMFAFTFVAGKFGRRAAFLAAFALCFVSVAYVFHGLRSETDAYWMLPIMGFATLSVFAGYSIYFPEIFPTRLRGTGVGFCYNTVRYLAAPFPFLLGWLSTFLPFRSVAMAMCGIYLVGIIALIWAPETKDKPLPED